MSDLITRAEAKAQGRARYFTGKPCKRGHVAERYVSIATCVECNSEAGRKRLATNPEYSRKHYAANRERYQEVRRKYYAANSEEHKARAAKWHANNPEKRCATVARWQANNPEKHCAAQASRRAAKGNRYDTSSTEGITYD